MNEIILNELNLKTFTEQDVLDYCQINNINPDNIKELDLWNNKLRNISGVKLFKNLEFLNIENNEITDISVIQDLKKLIILYLSGNEITDISVLENLNNLKNLSIDCLELESDQIQYIKNVEKLWCYEGFKNMENINQLNQNIEIYT